MFFRLHLANSTKLCYTYDNLNRVTKRTVKNLSDVVLSEEAYAYDAAGNITDAPDSCFSYDTNNRLTWYNGDAVGYDADGNMLSAVLDGTNGVYFTYDSANRLLTAGAHTYTYNAEDVRIRNLCSGEDTKYTYNTNCKLSKLLVKITNGVTTKYVYGRGLVGEETGNAFITYHFDCRGSTVALTDSTGAVTDTFAYDTYGGLISRTGTTNVIFLYNGRDGVVTDANGLIYMRARYYSPDMRRFINADIIRGSISDSTSLNRYAYVNGDPVSYIDPFGLAAERGIGASYSIYVIATVKPWGPANTHKVWKENHWKERWFGPDGRAVKDRHWTDHGSPGSHSIPHDQEWDWSNPDKPKLPKSSNPPDDPPSSPPPEGEEEWIQSSPSNNTQDGENENNSTQNSKNTTGFWVGVGMMGAAVIGLIWLVGNDLTGAGAVDDFAIAPTAGAFAEGMRLVLGS